MAGMRRMMLLAAAVLGGCATAELVMGPDGTDHYSIHCGNRASRCYAKMAEVCPDGYQIIDGAEGFTMVPVNGSVVGSASYDYLVKCRPATAAAGPPPPSAPAAR